MDRLVKSILVILIVALVPAVASATHLTDVSADSDCLGWSVSVSIRFHSSLFSLDGWYTVILSDTDGNELETIHWEGILDRPDPSSPYQTYEFNGEWTVFAPAGTYNVDVVAGISFESSWGQNVSYEMATHDVFECDVVSSESTTWSGLKSLYR